MDTNSQRSVAVQDNLLEQGSRTLVEERQPGGKPVIDNRKQWAAAMRSKLKALRRAEDHGQLSLKP